ncbi:hypothetical protein [Pseudoflavonifractor phocaeensis]|uniref:hypothetical protein n=1 Tax=Pseudoflavonifractor phocaeensis TaxID=1870988 RepID=UPI001F2A7A2B|nr:hypothetical protein [Pseudoflavonifractor phocaeensis]MCF2596149.1 hypothetical protein [Pseudoflavonifractor phocaeensis]
MRDIVKEFQKESHSLCGILWLMTAVLGLTSLMPFFETWLTAMNVVAFFLSLSWSIWASTAPKE